MKYKFVIYEIIFEDTLETRFLQTTLKNIFAL